MICQIRVNIIFFEKKKEFTREIRKIFSVNQKKLERSWNA